eukprot:scaffold98427_cov60-Phaeocystis_antarctica.AAC.2
MQGMNAQWRHRPRTRALPLLAPARSSDASRACDVSCRRGANMQGMNAQWRHRPRTRAMPHWRQLVHLTPSRACDVSCRRMANMQGMNAQWRHRPRTRAMPHWRQLVHLTPRVPAMSRVAGVRACREWTPRDATGLEPAPCPAGAGSFI